MMICSTCKRSRWDLQDGSNTFCLFEGSGDCLAFAADNPTYAVLMPEPAEHVPPPEGVHLTDDQAALARDCVQAYLRELRATKVEGRVERVLYEGKVDEAGDLLTVLNTRLDLLCDGCGTGPGYHCKLACSVRRYGPKGPARITLSVTRTP